MDSEKIKSHIHELEIKHRKLDDQVSEMELHHSEDDELHFLKKKRLAIRDEIVKMEAQING